MYFFSFLERLESTALLCSIFSFQKATFDGGKRYRRKLPPLARHRAAIGIPECPYSPFQFLRNEGPKMKEIRNYQYSWKWQSSAQNTSANAGNCGHERNRHHEQISVDSNQYHNDLRPKLGRIQKNNLLFFLFWKSNLHEQEKVADLCLIRRSLVDQTVKWCKI